MEIEKKAFFAWLKTKIHSLEIRLKLGELVSTESDSHRGSMDLKNERKHYVKINKDTTFIYLFSLIYNWLKITHLDKKKIFLQPLQ